MPLQTLSETQIEQFSERGWVRLPHAFARADALAVQDFIWQQLEKRSVLRDDRATWTSPMVQISETYHEPQFQACNTPRLKGAIEDLVGKDRWRDRDEESSWGWWPVNFPYGEHMAWDVHTHGWHWDGQNFRHYVDSGEQGLLLLCCFSDVKPQGGGTLVASGSHKIVPRFLQQHPEGVELVEAIQQCPLDHPWLADLTGKTDKAFDGSGPASENRIERFMNQTWTDENGAELRVEEITCEAGDVFLCHPFIYHTASLNRSGEPRIMCNRTTALKGKMQLERSDGNYSPLENSIRRALDAVAA